MKQCQKDMKKRSIIIQGGPGTVKSVHTINLLKEYIRLHIREVFFAF